MVIPLPPIELKPFGTWADKKAAGSQRGAGELSSASVGTSKPPRRFNLVPFDRIQLDASPAYLVRGVIPSEGLIVVWGPPKCGKSFWVFDAMLHIALGWNYRGRRVKQGHVVYIACEGERGIGARAEAFRRKRLTEEGSVPGFFLLPTRLDLVSDQQQLIDDIRSQFGSVTPAAVVIDTLNRSIAGSESSDEDMGGYVRAADTMREAFQCAVLIIHHCGVDDRRPRGHTSLTGAADAQIAVKRDDTGLIIASVQWLKDGAEGEETRSRLEVVELGQDSDGEEITSCVVEPADGEQPSKNSICLSPRQRQALEVLLDCVAEAGEPSPSGTHYPTAGRVVRVDHWREALLQSDIVDREGKNPRQDFRRLRMALEYRRAVRTWGDYVWPIVAGVAT
jgi:hypothetical protein